MKRFDVYSHTTYGSRAVKQGFSWPGFFFNAFWMAWCRMWVGAIALIVGVSVGFFVVSMIIGALFGSAMETMDDASIEEFIALVYWGCGLISSILVGAKGNEWHRRRLSKRGFTHLRTVEAASADAALAEAVAEEKAGQTNAC